MPAKAPLPEAFAYKISDKRLPWSKNTLYRYERLGYIKLSRVGGSTFLTSDTYNRLMSGEINLPQHSTRTREVKLARKTRPAAGERKAPR
jgi:hypothetical protein